MARARWSPKLGEVYDKLPPLLETKRITYTAADGLEIPAYLTLPRGKPPEICR
jgi:dipeptidyl aminopeptidase/acylaminoacyl peptidase